MFDPAIPPVENDNGGEVTEWVCFSLDGVGYQVDLSEENAQSLRRALARYLRGARRLECPAQDHEALAGRDAATWTKSRVIREWARDAGVTVCERGAIPKAVIAAYHREITAEHGDCHSG
jgi:hypothetical protein